MTSLPNNLRVDPDKVEYQKPAKALHHFYQDVVGALRSSPGKLVQVTQKGTLKDIAKKILVSPVPK